MISCSELYYSQDCTACSTSVSASLSGTGETEMCAGGVFNVGSALGGGDAGSSSSVRAWIVGDVLLKNVYTVFQGNPHRPLEFFFFAQLASGLSSEYILFSRTVYAHTDLHLGNTSSGTNPITITGTVGNPLPSSSGSSSGFNGGLLSVTLLTPLILITVLLSGLLITAW